VERTICTSHDHQACYGNSIYWYDTCNNQEDLVQSCGYATCSNGPPPECIPITGTCTGDYIFECHGQEGVMIDQSCWLQETKVTCTDTQVCVASENGVACRDQEPCESLPGTILCNNQCVDPLTSRIHCGRCNSPCGQTQLCVDGECELIPGCNVVCDRNEDCNEGEVCINAGSCTISECHAINLIEQNETVAEEIAALMTQGLVQFKRAADVVLLLLAAPEGGGPGTALAERQPSTSKNSGPGTASNARHSYYANGLTLCIVRQHD